MQLVELRVLAGWVDIGFGFAAWSSFRVWVWVYCGGVCDLW